MFSIFNSHLLLLLILILSEATFQKTNIGCVVDNCAVCPDSFVVKCRTCNNGYYVRTFSGKKGKYDDCWRVDYLWMFIWFWILLFTLCYLLCYGFLVCGRRSERWLLRNEIDKRESEPITERIQIVEKEKPIFLRPVPPPKQQQQ